MISSCCFCCLTNSVKLNDIQLEKLKPDSGGDFRLKMTKSELIKISD